jgi:hypothetical protein
MRNNIVIPVVTKDSPALIKAARQGDLEALLCLLDTGVDVNVRDVYDRTALMIAAAEGHTPVLWALLDRGADVNAVGLDGWTALTWAVRSEFYDILKILRDRGAVMKHQQYTAAPPRAANELIQPVKHRRTGGKRKRKSGGQELAEDLAKVVGRSIGKAIADLLFSAFKRR